MKRYILDFCGKTTPEQIHAHIQQVMQLPAHYGHNLDALYDCLSELSEPTCIGVYNVDASCGYMERLASMLNDISGENDNVCVFFAQRWMHDYLN